MTPNVDRLSQHLRALTIAANAARRAHRRGAAPGAIVAALEPVGKALRRAHARLIIDHLNQVEKKP